MFKVNAKRAEGFTDAEWARQVAACEAWEKCWNDPEFQQQVLDFGYSVQVCSGRLWWKKCKKTWRRGFTYTADSTGEVLKKMLSGSETLLPDVDGEADVEIACGNKKGVLGWTYANTLKQWVSRWFLNSASTAELAGNRAHEYMHKLGYSHPFNSTGDRPFSAPYAVGYLTRDWIKKNL